MSKNIFFNRFKVKSKQELIDIIKNKDRYTKEAVEAAQQLLDNYVPSTSSEIESEEPEVLKEKENEPLLEVELEKETINSKNYRSYLKPLFIIVVLLAFGIWFTKSSETPMDEVEKSLAQKYHAESLSLRFHSVEKTTNGELLDGRKFIKISVTNPDDFSEIMSGGEYADQKGQLIAQYVLDSIEFESIPFQPEELVVEFVEKSGVVLFSSKQSVVKTYNLSN